MFKLESDPAPVKPAGFDPKKAPSVTKVPGICVNVLLKGGEKYNWQVIYIGVPVVTGEAELKDPAICVMVPEDGTTKA